MGFIGTPLTYQCEILGEHDQTSVLGFMGTRLRRGIDAARAHNFQMSDARKRLHRDLKELEREAEHLTTISALPTSDIFVWHCNLRPETGPYKNCVFHIILEFDESYPRCPPIVKLCTTIPHPNVFGGLNGYPYICLDLLKDNSTGTPYEGWSSAYSVTSLLLQLQSFLFAENVPQDWGGTRAVNASQSSISEAVALSRRFRCTIDSCGGKVTHTHDDPWPLLPPRPTSTDEVAVHSAIYAAVARSPPPRPTAQSELSSDTLLSLPSFVAVHLFSFLLPKEVLQVRDVCSTWRRVVITFNLFERPQIMCFHSKRTLDDGCILGVGIKVKYYRDKNLECASSPLDLLSLEAFQNEGVRTGVWGGNSDRFDYFLPLIINNGHASKAIPSIARTMHAIMKNVPSKAAKPQAGGTLSLQPQVVLQFVSVLMNSMVVELVKDVTGRGVRRYASEKALEGYCAFHHMLLYFACQYPSVGQEANRQIEEFIASEKARLKGSTPNLGLLLVCLTLSSKGWQALWKPFLLEVFDRNVKWLIQKYPEIGRPNTLCDRECLQKTLAGSITSYRLLMFQVYFMTQIGRPEGSNGPADVLASYDKRLGRPTTVQKEQLQLACKDILMAQNWSEVLTRLQVPVPPTERLAAMLRQAVINSEHKKYHRKHRYH